MNIFKKTIVKDILTNIIYLLLISIYFVCFNTQAIQLENKVLETYINISSLTFLFISIVFFELGYRKNKQKVFINGIEFLVLAIFTLLIKHIPKVFGYTMETYTEVGTYAFIGYYMLKSAIIYTKAKHDELQSLSDIKEIVKEEPTKKETKRKNKKVEEGK